jgi:hypothetical protein
MVSSTPVGYRGVKGSTIENQLPILFSTEREAAVIAEFHKQSLRYKGRRDKEHAFVLHPRHAVDDRAPTAFHSLALRTGARECLPGSGPLPSCSVRAHP